MSSIAIRAIKSAIYYLIIGTLWILFSDHIVKLFITPENISSIQSFKGIFFVIVTSGILYFLILKEIKKEHRLFTRLQDQTKALESLTKKDEKTNEILKDTIQELENSYLDLKKSQTMYRTYINNSNEGIYRFQLNTPLDITLNPEELVKRIYRESSLEEFNPVFFKMYNISDPKEIQGKSLYDFHEDGERTDSDPIMLKFIESNFSMSDYETVETDADGEVKVFLNNTIGIVEDKKLTMIWGTQNDITERKKAQNELVEAKLKAEENDKLKSSFLANMSHEIRTPLNGIIGFAEMLVDDELENDQREKFVRIINNNSNQLLRIISDILDISKIETEQLIVKNKPLSLNELLSEIGLYLENEVARANKSVKVILEKGLDQDEDWIMSDNERLYQVITNLSNNALKFTNEGSIRIGYSLVGEDQLHFFVKDTGMGIPQEKRSIVFDRFRQVEGASTRKHGGVGLGLAISKGIVGLLGGNIDFTSQKGEGTEFFFNIPLIRPE